MSRYAITPISLDDLISAARLSSTVEFLGRSASAVVVTGLTQDSRLVQPGDMYCCVRGEHFDGHAFITEAVNAGAVAVLIDRDIENVSDEVAIVRVNDVRSEIGPIASIAFSAPSTHLTTVGITGTNGKTSTAAMVSSILSRSGKTVETMGTLTGERTTPEAIDLHAHLRECVSRGVTHVVMEVSSHALAQHRVFGMVFDVAVFTNLGRDHLDFHGTDEAYFSAKAKLFHPHQSQRGVVNVDDAHGQLLTDVAAIDLTSFSLTDADGISIEVDEVSFDWRGQHIVIPMGGMFTVMNALAAATACEVLGVSVADIAGGLKDLPAIPGRFQSVVNDLGIDVIVDYAHTPDGLAQVLTTARSVCSGRVFVVFGCGGNRDHGKRPVMGRTAADLADVVFVTSDNPRFEKPEDIIRDVVSGVPDVLRSRIHQIPDRGEAISSAISLAKRGDIVVIAGKGHELTQEVNGVHLAFSDVDQAHHVLREKKGGTLQ